MPLEGFELTCVSASVCKSFVLCQQLRSCLDPTDCRRRPPRCWSSS